jgi:hypothetical protein
MTKSLPHRIFFTGVPGSRWSGIAQHLEKIPGFNTSDRSDERTYCHNGFTGHVGAYFGPGMEFDCQLSAEHIDQAWTEPSGTKLVKSHHWAYQLAEINAAFPDDWIMLVYRPDLASYSWWHEAGGFNIGYPCYDSYKNSAGMMAEIVQQNDAILKFAHMKSVSWQYFTSAWVYQEFGVNLDIPVSHPDILVSLIR